MKNVVVLYSNDTEWHEEVPLQNSPETRAAFEDFYDFSRENGYSFYRADVAWYTPELGQFERGWTFFEGKWQHIKTPIVPDAVFDKVAGKHDYALFDTKMAMTKRFPVVNHPLFRIQFDNKLSQYLSFSEQMPRTFLAENQKRLIENLKKITTSKVVIKECYGSGGKQVSIQEKSAVSTDQPYPVLLQEFIETAGVPGFSNTGDVADLRLIYVNGSLVYALSRIAKTGSLFTNFHQGARPILVPLEKIPARCLVVADSINAKLSLFTNTNYSLDFMFTKDGAPLFIEMNTTPGFDLLRLVGTQEIKVDYYQKLLATLK